MSVEKRRARDNNLGIPDREIKLPQTERNRERAKLVDAHIQQHGGTRRAARRALLRREGKR